MSEPTIGRTEQEQAERGYPFIVRRDPLPVPAVPIDAQPAACATINLEWLGHILGAVEALNRPDAWSGTETEVYTAQQQIERLANQLKNVCEAIGGETMQFRQTGCTLEASTDGTLWTVIFDASCATPEPVQYRQNGCMFEVSTNGGGSWIPVFDASCATPEPVNFSQVDCTLNANGVKIFDASCAKTESAGDLIIDSPPDRGNYFEVCGIAKYLAEWFDTKWREWGNQIEAATDAGADIFAFAVSLTGVGFLAAPYIDWVASLTNTVFNTLQASVTTAEIESLQCHLFCTMINAGGYSAATIRMALDTFDAGTNLGMSNLISFAYAMTDAEFNLRALLGGMNPSQDCTVLCACGTWFSNAFDEVCVPEPWVKIIEGERIGNRVYEVAVSESVGRLVLEIDLSATTSTLTAMNTLTDSRGRGTKTGNREAKIEAFDETTGAYTILFYVNNTAVSPLPTSINPLPFETTKLRITFEGWNNTGTSRAWIQAPGLSGNGPDILELACQ